MTERKKGPLAKLDMAFGEALARFVRTDPKELAEATAAEVLQQREDAKKHQQAVRKELEDGARPRRGRFRL
jgi:hypothetical protein